MVSNTKAASFGLTKSCMKRIVSNFLQEYPNSSFFHNNNTGVTLLLRQEFTNSKVMQVATAVCSPDEKKYRKSVGEYICVEAYINGGYINIPSNNICAFIDSLMH